MSSITTSVQASIVTDTDAICELAQFEQGAWIDIDGLKDCLAAKEGLTFLREISDSLEEDLKACNQSLGLAMRSEDLCADLNSKFDTRIQEQDFLLHELRRDITLWYRQPLLVGSLGIILGAILTAGATLAL